MYILKTFLFVAPGSLLMSYYTDIVTWQHLLILVVIFFGGYFDAVTDRK